MPADCRVNCTADGHETDEDARAHSFEAWRVTIRVMSPGRAPIGRRMPNS
jgi:hypothetical protein